MITPREVRGQRSEVRAEASKPSAEARKGDAPGRFLRGLIAPALFLILTGCASKGASPQAAGPKPNSDAAKMNAWMAQQPLDLPATVYRVAPPDKVRIVAPNIKEIDGQETVIRPDGTMSLNLVGDVKVAGLTPGEISEVLAQRLSTYYKADTIDVSVQVVDFKSQHFYVFGQVAEPGVKPYTGRDTILKVLADAKLNEEAWPQKVVIVRPNEDPNVHQRVTVDVKEMWENGKTQQNFLVEPGDVVYVPMSPLADVKQTVARIVSPIIPATDLGLMIFTGGI